MTKYILLILFLLILSIEDIRNKEISVPLLIGLLTISLITGLYVVDEKLNILIGLIPGVIIIVLSKITKGKIGMADGIVVAGIGMCFGFVKACSIFLIGIALSTIIGLIVIAIKKKGRDFEMPFVPFLLIGTTLCAVI